MNAFSRRAPGSAGCQPAVFGSLPKTLCSRVSLQSCSASHLRPMVAASCRDLQAGSLRYPKCVTALIL